MANPEHLAILEQGVEVWNKWREENPSLEPDLSNTNLIEVNYDEINLSKANLSNVWWTESKFNGSNCAYANLSNATLVRTDLQDAELSNANLSNSNANAANLSGARLFAADLTEAVLAYTNLRESDLTLANLTGANLQWADLTQAILRGTTLRWAFLDHACLSEALLINTDFSGATLANCRIFGMSAWKIKKEGSTQTDLIITDYDEPSITVDSLEIAQFVYLLLHNEKLRDVIDTLTTKSVLILGRFSPERKVVLDAIRVELRKRGYIPILFDFEKPANRDLTETVMTLASLSRFVIADLSDPNSIPHELMSFARNLLSVPVKPVFCLTKEHPKPYPMLEDLQRYPHVLPTYFYDTGEHLIAALAEHVIEPAEAKAQEMQPRKLGA